MTANEGQIAFCDSIGKSKEEVLGPLEGLRVIDFSIVMAGPMCGRMLADAGAEVIKVEAPGGDVFRQRPPFRSEYSTYFAALNSGKRSVVLDLRTEDGRQVAKALLSRADVVIENFRPGVMSRLGLDFKSVSVDNPRLVYCSVSGFGQTGPLAEQPAYAPMIHAASGLGHAQMLYQGSSERPANDGIFIADVLGAIHAAYAIQLALYDRERTGRGQYIDVAMMDAILGALVYETQAAQFPPEHIRQVYQPVKASDGYVMIVAVTQKNVDAMFDAIGFPEGKSDPRFATIEAKEENWSVLLGLMEDWTLKRTSAECERTLMEAGVPCSRYKTVAEAMSEEQTSIRGLMSRVGAETEPFLIANGPSRFSRSRNHVRHLLADLGAHTDEVLNEVLGYQAGEIARLRERGAFGPDRSGE